MSGRQLTGNFLGGLDSQADVTFTVTDYDDGLETSSLTGPGLLLNRLDLHDLVLELRQEEVDNLVPAHSQKAA